GPGRAGLLLRGEERLHLDRQLISSDERQQGEEMGKLDGKVGVITGGCSGIGLATARKFVAEGAKVVIGDLDEVNGPRIAEELDGVFVTVNVTDQAQVENLFKVANDTYGHIDIAFNNAGISPAS